MKFDLFENQIFRSKTDGSQKLFIHDDIVEYWKVSQIDKILEHAEQNARLVNEVIESYKL